MDNLSKMVRAEQKPHKTSELTSRFLANISHELRTPMSGIIGFAELALHDCSINHATRNYLTKIKDCGENLLGIINDVLAAVQIEAGTLELEAVAFDLRSILSQCKEIYGIKAAEKDVQLVFCVEPGLDKTLIGDQAKLRQILLILLSNSVKFTDSGTIQLAATEEALGENSVTIRFEVKDSGVGMSAEQLKHACEPFWQADDSTTRKCGGAGLGLCIAKNYIGLMGGALAVETVPGGGSKFSFALTFATTDKQALPAPNAAKLSDIPRFAGEVLLCEDSEANQQIVSDNLKLVGLSYVIANNGREGVDIVARRLANHEKPFDLILMDMHMPVMDGLDAAAALRKLGNKAPIVAYTANISAGNREIYWQHGIMDFLGKPFTARELWACLLRYFTPTGFQSMGQAAWDEAGAKARKKLISNFVEKYQNAHSEINAALADGDISLAHRIAHTLGSLGGMLGRSALMHASRAVERTLTGQSLAEIDEAALENQMREFNRQLTAALHELAPLLDEPRPEPINAAFDAALGRELFDELELLLRESSVDVLDMTDELRIIPGTGNLIAQIDDYEFNAALVALAELRKKLGI